MTSIYIVAGKVFQSDDGEFAYYEDPDHDYLEMETIHLFLSREEAVECAKMQMREMLEEQSSWWTETRDIFSDEELSNCLHNLPHLLETAHFLREFEEHVNYGESEAVRAALYLICNKQSEESFKTEEERKARKVVCDYMVEEYWSAFFFVRALSMKSVSDLQEKVNALQKEVDTLKREEVALKESVEMMKRLF